jgi:hypothetical protein
LPAILDCQQVATFIEQSEFKCKSQFVTGLFWSHQENKIVALSQKLYKNTYINNFYSQKDKNYIRDAAGFKMDMGTCVGFADSIIWQNLSFAS